METGAFTRRLGSGRSRVTSQRDDRFIFLTSLRNRRLNGVKIQQQLRDLREVNISQWTVRRRLRERNMTPHPPATGPKLTVTNRQIRLRFATEHLDWNLNQWSSIMFS